MRLVNDIETLWLTTRDAALILGVHESTVKRLCNDDVLPTRKTPGGHRRLALASVLDWAEREKMQVPLTVFNGQAAQVWRALQDAADGDFAPAAEISVHWLLGDKAHLFEPFIRLLYKDGRIEFPRLLDFLTAQVMHRIGESWERGEIGVGQEHYSTQHLVDALHALRHDMPARNYGYTPPRAIVGCTEGELHDLGALSVRLILEANGWLVDYLGANVPVSEFAVMQRRRKAELVCMSFVPPHGPADGHQAIRFLSQMYDSAAPYSLVLGGSGLGRGYTPPPGRHPFESLNVFSSLADLHGWLSRQSQARAVGEVRFRSVKD